MSTTTTIYFIRHGETQANELRVFQGRIDSPLTDKGKQQIISTCHDIQNMDLRWDAIYCSTLNRAKETCDIITSFFPRRKPVIYTDEIIERDFGQAEGIKINEINYHKIMKGDFEGEETEEEIIERAQKFIKSILDKHFCKEVLVITHSHFLKACFIPYLNNLKFNSKTQNGGISVLKFNNFNHLRIARMDINKNDN